MVTTGMKHLWEVDIGLSESAHNRVLGSGTGLPESGIGYPAGGRFVSWNHNKNVKSEQ
jgi:hypothetical protein